MRLTNLWPSNSRSNWNLVFEEGGKTGEPEKKPSEQRWELTTNSTHIWRRDRESNPGHIGGRRALSPLRHPCSQAKYIYLVGSWAGGRRCWIRSSCNWSQRVKARLIKIFLMETSGGVCSSYPHPATPVVRREFNHEWKTTLSSSHDHRVIDGWPSHD